MSLIPIHSLSIDPIDRDTLHLLVQSPTVLFAYWRLSERKRAMILEHYEKDWQLLQPSLRIYDVTDLSFDGMHANEISAMVLPQDECCFLSGFHPGKHYVADLGIRNDQQQFIPLLRSNSVCLPWIASMDEHGSTPTSAQYHIQFLPYDSIRHSGPSVPYEQFSAYSIYTPTTAYSVDTESGGDTD
ncbi:DUF4912 domain-containing protein [Paenibacillus sp. N3.4]|uniref:DUF4912 domain-containing protein n=1 Tax=Paenibacillus sp. N3.4 TaxID=2603222 RepID=UPI001650588C|nr:DUF4912 domain-containing protein [Paenibacillus sp. N3.4]